ncbi:MAG: hydrogenase maturation nickel metallochaperone HypA [Desulfobacteraceae bacterium]|nr:hydrogenase maturation nickel metallochaperone HypA [Desulfobacteraceae bacterium]
MHELPLTNKILETAIDFAEKNNAVQIQEINLLIGELSDIEEHWLNHYFRYISKDTIASDANLKITRVNIKWLCLNCFFEFEETKNQTNRQNAQNARKQKIWNL